MNEKYILHGPSSLRSVSKDSFGIQLCESLLQNINLPCAMVHAVTGEEVSYKAIWNKSRSLALNLQKYGVIQNDVIAIFSENNLEYVYPIIAAMYLGAIITGINSNYSIDEVLHCTSISKPVIMFCSKNTFKVASEAGQQMEYLKKIVVMDTKDKFNKYQSLENLTSGYSEKELQNVVPLMVNPSEQVAFILYSSGTTGLPKGVLLTHNNVNAVMDAFRDPKFFEQCEPGTNKALMVLPFSHVYGLFTLLRSLILGIKVVVLNRFTPSAFLKAIHDYKVTELYLVPYLLSFLAATPLAVEYDLSSFKRAFCGSTTLSKSIEEAIKKRFKLQTITTAYGMTELTLMVAVMPLGESKIESCGKLLPGVSAKVIGLDSRMPLGPKESGELCFKGEQIMKGYAGNVKATKEIIDEDGWLHTGDIGYYDEDGFFFITGRLKELIKYKSYQIAPAELEELLMTHPDIQDVGIVGLPDESAGEVPLAFIVKKPNSDVNEQEIKHFMTLKISPQKQLHGGVRFVNEIPKTSTGKILRNKLRELL